MSVTITCEGCDGDYDPTVDLLCPKCVADKMDEAVPNCDRCGDRPAECCDNCADGGMASKAMEWAGRRKALGLLSAECFEAFELFASDLEAGDA